jgi:hypothetical protein
MSHVARHTNAGKCLVAAVLLMLMVGAPQVLAADDVTGEWEVTMDFGGRPMYASLTISKNADGTLAGKWGSDDLSNVKFDGQKLTFLRTVRWGDNEFSLNYAGTLANDKIAGTLSSDQGDFPANAARRRPISPAVGVWDLKYAVGDRDMTAKLTVSQKPDGTLDAKWVSERGESVVSNVKFQDGKLTFDRTAKFNDQEIKMTFAGTAQGDKLTGLTKSERGEIPVDGTRAGAEIIGKWELTSVSDMGTWTIHMMIYPDLSGRYEFFGGEIPMKNVKFENGQLVFVLEVGPPDQTFQLNFKGKVEGQTLKGQMTSEQGTSEITGKKLPAAAVAPAASASASSIIGTWEFTRETQDGTRRTNTLKIKPDMTGTYTMRDTEVPVTDLKVSGNDVTFKAVMKFNDNEVPMEFKGTLEGKTLKGEFTTSRGPREAIGKKID